MELNKSGFGIHKVELIEDLLDMSWDFQKMQSEILISHASKIDQ